MRLFIYMLKLLPFEDIESKDTIKEEQPLEGLERSHEACCNDREVTRFCKTSISCSKIF